MLRLFSVLFWIIKIRLRCKENCVFPRGSKSLSAWSEWYFKLAETLRLAGCLFIVLNVCSVKAFQASAFSWSMVFILQHWSVSLLKENMPEQDKRRYGFILPNWPCLLKCNSCHWVFCGVGGYLFIFFYWAFNSCILFPHNLAWSYYTVARIFLGHNQGHCFCLFCYCFSQVFLKLSLKSKRCFFRLSDCEDCVAVFLFLRKWLTRTLLW